MKFLNPLVVSDNPLLAQRIQEVVRKIDVVVLKFACTDQSILEEFREKVDENALLINLKNSEDVNKIMQTFDLILSIHCKQLFPVKLVQHKRCINLHPGYNPTNRGWYPQVFAIIHHRISGATLHEIDTLLDHGRIIDRIEVPQYSWDSSKSLYDRIVDVEVEIFARNFLSILNDEYTTFSPEDEGFLYYKKDFNQLCEIELDEPVTFYTAINRLRALTHGAYQNAWYRDKVTGRKVFIKIDLIPEDEAF